MPKSPYLKVERVLLFITLSAALCFNSCKSAKKQIDHQPKITFTIDERTEFFRIIFNLAFAEELDEELRPCQTNYSKSVDRYFIPFKKHPLIQALTKTDVRIDFSALGLMYKDLVDFQFDLNYVVELPNYGISFLQLETLRSLFIDFYKTTSFKEFFDDHQAYYKNALKVINREINQQQVFEKLSRFYQSDQKDLEFIVFVELTNNANNKAITFFDHYNPKKRAIILANICEMPDKISSANSILRSDKSIRSILYHEVSHLFTSKLLEKHMGLMRDYRSLCKDCDDAQLKDQIDHMIIVPLQVILASRFDKNCEGKSFFEHECTDVRKEIYRELLSYDPQKHSFEKTYARCLALILKAARAKETYSEKGN